MDDIARTHPYVGIYKRVSDIHYHDMTSNLSHDIGQIYRMKLQTQKEKTAEK